jgi:acyl carrier protein
VLARDGSRVGLDLRLPTLETTKGFLRVNEDDIYRQLTDIFHDVFDDDSIIVTPGLSATDLDAWDSLMHIRLIVTVEKAFKIKVATAEVGKLQNVGELVELIKSRV